MPATPQPSPARSASKPAALSGGPSTNGAARRPADARPAAAEAESIGQCVQRSLEQYFASLGGAKPHALHDMVMTAVERPLLQFALERCGGNQSAAAQLLGINRNTLRKKLVEHGMAA
jgi:Fis family transcriptional regulator